MESGEKVIRISVRNLVEFILKEGDIDNRITAGTAEKDAMLMGSRLHRKIQKSMGSGYQAEVPLKISVPCQEFTLRIEGRADGIIADETSDGKLHQVTVDEIKGVLRNLEQIQKPAGVHLAQAKCYAYIYGKEKELDKIVMVGDRSYDILGGHAEGLKVIGVLYGYGDLKELSQAGADALATTPQEVVELVLATS